MERITEAIQKTKWLGEFVAIHRVPTSKGLVDVIEYRPYKQKEDDPCHTTDKSKLEDFSMFSIVNENHSWSSIDCAVLHALASKRLGINESSNFAMFAGRMLKLEN